MLHRIVEISEEGRRLSLSRGFLVVHGKSGELGRVPLDDIAVLMVSAIGCSISKPLLAELAGRGAVTVLCDKQYNPVFSGLPEAASGEAVGRIHTQIEASLPLKKNIWKTIVRQKLKNQAKVLRHFSRPHEADKIDKILERVQSGDKDNKEAWAARIYWKALFGEDFKRDKDEPGINALLNYGYTILRSACARAIVGSGLLPMFGLMHRNRRNYFALADDIVEPFRPVVDFFVKLLEENYFSDMSAETKHEISGVLWLDVKGKKGVSPIVNSIQDTALSLVDSFRDKKNSIFFPTIPFSKYALKYHVFEQI